MEETKYYEEKFWHDLDILTTLFTEHVQNANTVEELLSVKDKLIGFLELNKIPNHKFYLISDSIDEMFERIGLKITKTDPHYRIKCEYLRHALILRKDELTNITGVVPTDIMKRYREQVLAITNALS